MIIPCTIPAINVESDAQIHIQFYCDALLQSVRKAGMLQ
jgi:hypothetical protein